MPVGHCELNPIKLAWEIVKECIRKHNKQFTMSKIEESDNQRNCKKVEDDYWEKDGLIEETVEEFTIQFGTDSDDDDNSDF